MSDGATIELCGHVRVLRAGLRIEACRSGGPGGQHVNTAASAVVLHCPLWALIGLDEAALERLRRLAGRRLTTDDELVLRCEQDRSQQRNRELVTDRLRELVAQAMRAPKKRRPTKRSRGSVERRLQAKRVTASKKARRRDSLDED